MIRATLAAIIIAGSLVAGAGPRAEEVESAFAAARDTFDIASQSGDPAHPGYAEAYGTWKRLADAGHIPSHYHLGILNLYGIGGAWFDQALAIERIRVAAAGRYFMAQSFMGFLYEHSDEIVVKRDEAVALEWYRKGAENGHCVSVRRLATAYERGQLGLVPDEKQANSWRAHLPDCRSR